jgi:hypothetical protein
MGYYLGTIARLPASGPTIPPLVCASKAQLEGLPDDGAQRTMRQGAQGC